MMSRRILAWSLGRQVESFPDADKFVVGNIMNQGGITIYASLINVE